ncbi:MAG: hypothetical protein H0W47_11550 [Polaromonas sp.]|uniref:hypothetical protein n=1 Tax=Polaromonas sp. TaxID=1869339 RepID=UPI001831308D|nr:hypothetical protein [Polaromonas sp.]MBA3594417.1 hypothetical protein [Polaromonas sp.]
MTGIGTPRKDAARDYDRYAMQHDGCVGYCTDASAHRVPNPQMQAPGRPPLVALKAEIALDCLKLTPERRMDEIELLTELGKSAMDLPEWARLEARPFNTDASLQLK